MTTTKRAVERYGAEHQTWKAVEEMGELQQAICKYQLATDPLEKDMAILDLRSEIADVCIMMEQLRLIYGEKMIDVAIAYKLERLEKRMGRDQ